MVLSSPVVVTGGCVWATSQSEKSHGLEARGMVAHDKRFGGGVQAMASTAGLQIAAELDSREFRSRDDPRSTEVDEHAGAALAMSLRLSIPGVLPTDHPHRTGSSTAAPEIGGGIAMLLGTPGFTGGPESFAGAWIELGKRRYRRRLPRVHRRRPLHAG